MRYQLLALALVACSKGATISEQAAPPVAAAAPIPTAPADAPAGASADAGPPPGQFATLADALKATIPADARVIGFGELHARVDRAQVTSALAQFTEALPAFGDKVSDLIVETFIVDPKCGQQAQTTTKAMETEVKRPEATKSEIALLADAAKALAIQPHAMTLTCADYKTLMPAGQIDPVAMLTITTRELERIALSAIAHRDKEPDHRPWIALYGGALHNDRFPDKGLEEWSYARAVDGATGNHFVEVDIISPELAMQDAASKKQPWFSLAEHATPWVQVFARGERSFVLILPELPKTP